MAIRFRLESEHVAMRVSDAVTAYIGGEIYEGTYDVRPEITAQTLPTANKQLIKDIHVQEIPYHEVGNTEGGMTAIIGGVPYYGVQ